MGLGVFHSYRLNTLQDESALVRFKVEPEWGYFYFIGCIRLATERGAKDEGVVPQFLHRIVLECIHSRTAVMVYPKGSRLKSALGLLECGIKFHMLVNPGHETEQMAN